MSEEQLKPPVQTIDPMQALVQFQVNMDRIKGEATTLMLTMINRIKELEAEKEKE